MSELLRISDLTFSYPGQCGKALNHVSLSVERGDFLVLCGASGSGKSTLLRLCKPAIAPHGVKTGEVLFEGVSLEALDIRTQSEKIGFVSQSPESQLVTGKAWRELAFGLESLGLSSDEIRRRVAETASFFGIQNWFWKDVNELSGGQKQILNVASVMAMWPSLLLLDEPAGQLDPIAALDLFTALERLNRELGVTVVLSEHRLEDAFPLAHSAAVLDGGKLLCAGPPREVGEKLRVKNHPMLAAMPAPMRVWAGLGGGPPCPVTVREGRAWLENFARERPLPVLPPEERHEYPDGNALEAKDLWYRYEKEGPDVVKGLSLVLKRGEFLALLGGNGTGKTTALKLLSGVYRPIRGKLLRQGRTALLPQDPRAVFIKDTLREDFLAFLETQGISEAERKKRMEEAVSLCRLERLLDRHPFDLSGGEGQRAALAKVLLAGPDILLLDEPTKGLDAVFKQELARILQELLRQGKAVLLASHDVEFCAQYAHRCALFFDGAPTAWGPPREFFSGNSFYTTAASRMAGELLPGAVTVSDFLGGCPSQTSHFDEPPGQPKPPGERPRPVATEKPPEEKPSQKSRWLSKPAAKASLGIFLLIPLTLYLGPKLPVNRSYYITALLVLLECMIPFFLLFEGRKPKAGELVTVASLCALGVAGRAAFFMLPQCKPVMAITIAAGAAFGGETGFLVGAVSMLVSNLFYSQGPWTPWQMFAMGLTGFVGGLVFHRTALKKSRTALGLYGALAAVLIYGAVMNFSSALTWGGELTPEIILAYVASGFPFDCAHAASTFVFLWLGGRPLLKKLDRIKTKYGLLN